METVLPPTPGAGGSASGGAEWWDRFVAATSADEFCRCWLALVCEKIPGVRGAAVMVESVDAGTFVPIAVWPAADQNLAHLGAVVQRALTGKQAVTEAAPAGPQHGHYLAYPIQVGARVVAAVALDVRQYGNALRLVLRQLHWDCAWLTHLFAERERDLATQSKLRFQSVLEMIAMALRHGKLQQALFDVTNTLRQHFACSHVAIGLVKDLHVRVAAISDTATFEKSSPLVKAYAGAMDEALDNGKPTLCCRSSAEQLAGNATAPAHAALIVQSGTATLCSFPATLGGDCVGVVTLGFAEERTMADIDTAWLDAFLALFAQIIEQRREAERSSIGRFASECRHGLDKLFGPRHLAWKASASLLLLITAILVLVPVDYRVSAKTVIEGEVQRVAAAPFEGFLDAGFVRAGNTVRKGQVLARLDDRQLRIEQVRWASERDQYERKLREAMANHDLTAVRVVSAQLKQAEAQFNLVTDKITRSVLVAPYDGIVVSGDVSQQIGSPVEAGKKLFEIAPLNSYRVILQVEEREIRHVRNGLPGHLLIAGIAGEAMDFSVVNVTPVATAEEGKNFFKVEARLRQASTRLRPGMEGIGKIEVGRRSLWWVLTHGFTEWLTLSLWTWMP